MDTIAHWIGGRSIESPVSRRGPVYDPATGERTAEVLLAGTPEIDEAVRAAGVALSSWRDASLARRSAIFFEARELLRRRADDLASAITREHGKTLEDARAEVQRGLEIVEFACGIPQLLKGGFSENVSTGVDSYSILQPLGIVAGITPFNFPAMVPMWMYPIAIACGNTFVLKPSEKTPSASLLAAQTWSDAGLPDGVLNVVNGDAEAVNLLLDHPEIAAVSFVGSTPIARAVYERATAAGKRVQALGGAKNHAIVLPDADLKAAAEAIIGAAYGSAGERCMAISAVVAVSSAGDPFVSELKSRALRLTVGPGDDSGTQMGPLITEQHRDRVAGYVDSAEREGAELVLDGRDLEVDGHENGFFLGPCLIDRVSPEMTVYRDEIFGPVLVVVRVETLDDAIGLVNRNPYGNGATLFTRDGAAARRFRNEIDAGMVGINVPIPVPTAAYSFGGRKTSMFGDLHTHGIDAIRFYTRPKVVTERWISPSGDGRQLVFPAAE